MTLFEDLEWRGQIKDRTFADSTWLNEPKTFYLGTDCSSDSLTIGNLAVYMLARRLVQAGWKPVLLVGGATSLIGDPGGKTQERELISIEEVRRNVVALTHQVKHLLDNDDIAVVNNYDWFKDIGYLDFLRDIGKHYSMTELLQRDFVTERIGEHGSGISYAEFSYSLIQGYDFMHLYQSHNVVLQIGGSDQWGNMLSGVPLIRKKLNGEVHALSMPLVINKATGTKFGKSEEGAIWLDESKTSVYKFYQFWINVDDESVEDYLKIYTELSQDDIADIMQRFRDNPADRLAHETLALKVTGLIHGADRAARIQRLSKAVFNKDADVVLQDQDLTELESEVPVIGFSTQVDMLDVLVNLELVSSKSEARRFLTNGGLYINNIQASADKAILNDDDFRGKYVLLRLGKNKLALVKKNGSSHE